MRAFMPITLYADPTELLEQEPSPPNDSILSLYRLYLKMKRCTRVLLSRVKRTCPVG